MSVPAEQVATPIRIDLGAGKHPKDGFIGVDSIDFGNGNVICNIGKDKWPWEDNSVEEAHSSHTLEHLTNLNDKWERVHFFNELGRVLKPGGKCLIIIPHWSSNRFYGDPTHKEPFSEMGWYYLNKAWRDVNAPHACIEHSPNGYSCDFDFTAGYNFNPLLANRNEEYKNYALTWFKEAATDMFATLTKR